MIGKTISHYRILEKLGEGGMGIVYKAEDTRLKRIVALKFLSAIALSGEEKSRFLREAQAAAALNHPNICTIYAIDEVDGQMFIAMEYIEGQSLREKIEAGPLKIDEAIKFATQVADGLQAAHEKGITHRDIKSANIMITEKNQVKIMDFGLAKLARGSKALWGGTMLTKEGMTLGTAAYMSPEQARGEAVDHRTDIWSFGVVLYEMISGRLPFRGEYESAMMYSILNEEPEPLTSLRSNVPMDLERVVAKMLAKNPAARYQHVDELPVDLKAIATASAGKTKISTKPIQQEAITKIRTSRESFLWILAGILALALLALAIVHFWKEPLKPQTIRSLIHPPENTTFAYNIGVAGGGHIAVSPDGSTLAFVTADSTGRNHLWVRPLNSLSSQQLSRTEGAHFPFWSPDSRFIGFFAAGKLKKIAVSRGLPMTICDAANAKGGTWNQKGVILFSPSRFDVIYQVSAAGGTPTAVTTLDTTHHDRTHRWPHFLPDGKHFLYFAGIRGGTEDEEEDDAIYVASLDGQVNKRLLPAQSNMAYAGGYLFYVRENKLMAQPFDAKKLELMGDAVAIAERVQYSDASSRGVFSMSQSGILVYQEGSTESGLQLVWFDRSGKSLGSISEPAPYLIPRLSLSNNGKKIAVGIYDPESQNSDLWIYDLTRNLRTRLTFDPSAESYPIWSPDGNDVVFISDRKGHRDLYQKTTSGAGTEELLFASNFDKLPQDWSSDGRFIAYMSFNPMTEWDLWILPLFDPEFLLKNIKESRGKPMPFLQTKFNERGAHFSPDMRWIAYGSDESGRNEIYVQPFPRQSGDGKWQASTNGGSWPTWRRDGKELFYVSRDGKLMAAEVLGIGSKALSGSTFEVGAVRPLFDISAIRIRGNFFYDVTADGQRFLIAVPAEGQASAPLTLMTNWDQEVKKK